MQVLSPCGRHCIACCLHTCVDYRHGEPLPQAPPLLGTSLSPQDNLHHLLPAHVQITDTVYPMFKVFIEPALQTAQLRITNAFNPFEGVFVGQVRVDRLLGFGHAASCDLTDASIHKFSAPLLHGRSFTTGRAFLCVPTLCSNPAQGSCPPPTC